MDVVIGFDPGGQRQFGWAVAELTHQLPLKVLALGCDDHAAGVLASAFAAVPADAKIKAAGIDSPMFWRPSGDRRVDKLVREALRSRRAKSPSGTVQNVNSLRGACVVQGLAVALLLRRVCPGLPLTESHPKALMVLLNQSATGDFGHWLIHPNTTPPATRNHEWTNEHHRDAALGALGAWAKIRRPTGWADLLPQEPEPLLPVEAPLAYWMSRIVGEAAV